MSNLIKFSRRPVKFLWAPKKGLNPSWRLFASNQVIDIDLARVIKEQYEQISEDITEAEIERNMQAILTVHQANKQTEGF